MVLIGQKPIVWHIMKLYAHHGYRDFVLCLGYRGQMIKEYFLNYEAMNNDFTIHLGSKTRIDYLDTHDEQDFRVTLADTGQETDDRRPDQEDPTPHRRRHLHGHLWRWSVRCGYRRTAEIPSFPRPPGNRHGHAAPSRFGMLAIAEDGRVTRFAEKPQTDGWANAGFFIFNTRVFDYLDSDQCILEREPLERLSADGQLMVYRHHGFFFAMDTYREFQLLNGLWNEGKAPWKVWS